MLAFICITDCNVRKVVVIYFMTHHPLKKLRCRILLTAACFSVRNKTDLLQFVNVTDYKLEWLEIRQLLPEVNYLSLFVLRQTEYDFNLVKNLYEYSSLACMAAIYIHIVSVLWTIDRSNISGYYCFILSCLLVSEQ